MLIKNNQFPLIIKDKKITKEQIDQIVNVLRDSVNILDERFILYAQKDDYTTRLEYLDNDVELLQTMLSSVNEYFVELAGVTMPGFETLLTTVAESKASNNRVNSLDLEVKLLQTQKMNVHGHPYRLDTWLPHLNELSEDSNNRLVTDDEKVYWNAKSEAHAHPYRLDTWVPTFAEIETPTTLEGYGITDAMTALNVGLAISTAVDELVGSAPGTLNTFQEIADLFNDDPTYFITLNNLINNKAEEDHDHDLVYKPLGWFSTWEEVTGKPTEFPSEAHPHVETDITDLDKYTQAEINTFLLTKSNTGHTHVEANITNLDKYTQAQVNAFLLTKSNTGHAHVETDITDLNKYTKEEVESKVTLVTGHKIYNLSLTDIKGEPGEDGLDGGIGPKGDDGDTGPQGDNLGFNWSGTSLGVNVAGGVYTYVNLKGDQGIQGIQGEPGSDATVTQSAVLAVIDIADLSGRTATEITTEIGTAISNLLGSASSAYDTLKELEDELKSNDSGIAALVTSVAGKAPLVHSHNYVATGARLTGDAGDNLVTSIRLWDVSTSTETESE